ncbi:Peroxisomal membrane protein LPX1 [Grifola frondosa]|uniref:Peroxisomal membrane protein LPX1 n=1 Tax=Grifola frondosa TaxID=5627 RepID=A0A1C7LZC1_GRIFR|nr:Peroxisomal membrane protein LPX1 [Grifola frondosa]
MRPNRREVLWTIANRYVNTDQQKTTGLTLVFLHGIGAHKETWTPVIQCLVLEIAASSSPLYVNEIWAMDCVQHGDSGLLNEASLGDTFDCADYARDLTNFLLHYLPEDTSPARRISTNLFRLPESVTDRRKIHRFSNRTVVGVGHSVGACSLINPAVEYPALLSSLVLVESMTIPEYVKYIDGHRKNEAMCLRRRWLWDSIEDATRDIHKSGYYRSWDPKCLQQFLKYAIIRTSDGKFRLKTHPYFESLMMYERLMVYEAWELLDKINPSITMHWVWGGKSERAGGPVIQITYRRKGNCSNDVHPNVGHLLPQEIPDLLGMDIFRFLCSRYCERGSRL